MMRYRFIMTLAYRHLYGRRKQSALSLLGIAVGVMILISALGLMDGLLRNFEEKVISSAPHITIQGEKNTSTIPTTLTSGSAISAVSISTLSEPRNRIANVGSMIEYLNQQPVILAFSPVISSQCMATYGIRELPVSVMGVTIEKEDQILNLTASILAGSIQESQVSPDAVVMGKTVADDLGVNIGDRIILISSQGVQQSMRVLAIFSTGVRSLDIISYVSLRTASVLEGIPSGEATEIHIKVQTIGQIDQVAHQIEQLFGYQAETWKETNASALSLFRMIGSIMYFLIAFVLIVGGMGVANVLITIVFEKARDIAIMRALGYSKRDIALLFFIESLVLGLVGAAIGCLFGFGLSHTLMLIPSHSGNDSMIQSENLYVRISLSYFLLASTFAVIVSIIAGVFPARRAARVQPLNLLRGEQ